MRTIKEIIIHCTATPQNWTAKNFVNEWKNKGWKVGGYHYIIYPNGTIDHTIKNEQISNGCRGHNAHAINVAYVGGVDAQGRAIDNRTVAQKKSMRQLIMILHDSYPDAKIIGHRDIWGANPRAWKKMCPSFDVRKWLTDAKVK